MFQGISLKRRGRERETEREKEIIDLGEAKLVQKPHNFMFTRCLYTLSFT